MRNHHEVSCRILTMVLDPVLQLCNKKCLSISTINVRKSTFFRFSLTGSSGSWNLRHVVSSLNLLPLTLQQAISHVYHCQTALKFANLYLH